MENSTEKKYMKIGEAAMPDQRITLNLMGRVLAQRGAGPGSRVCLALSPEALHIMPVR